MNWWVQIGRVFVVILLIIFAVELDAYIYVYEVTTTDRRFQTASKLSPSTFLLSNGGKDLIKELKVVKVYADNDFKKALKEFKLESENVNVLLPKKAPDDRSVNPYIWWR